LTVHINIANSNIQPNGPFIGPIANQHTTYFLTG
jgi:hypothetical protein